MSGAWATQAACAEEVNCCKLARVCVCVCVHAGSQLYLSTWSLPPSTINDVFVFVAYSADMQYTLKLQ